MEISFPASRSCLWDETVTGEAIILHLTSSGWMQLSLNSNVIDMAIQHSLRQSCDSEVWLMGTSIITKNNSIRIEVNRFDPGKWIKTDNSAAKLHPTIVLPGDIAIHCRVMNRRGCGSSNEGILTHNLSTLQNSFSLLDQRIKNPSVFEYHHMMSYRVIIIRNDHHSITVKGGCVVPSSQFQLHPLPTIPLLQTSLSRTITNPKSVHSTIRVGYLSMDECRKLVPILPSDSCVSSLPLVGIWLSGVDSIDHPAVWSMCLHYVCTTNTLDRVYGNSDGRGFIVLLPGLESSVWQCSIMNMNEWAWHIGELTTQLSSLVTSFELMPCVDGLTGSTLLHSAIVQWKKKEGLKQELNDSLPCLSPAPFPVSVPSFIQHDSDLSCVSDINTPSPPQQDKNEVKVLCERCTNATNNSSEESGDSNSVLEEYRRQLEELQEQVKLLLSEKENSYKEPNIQTTPTTNASTNTGMSLLEDGHGIMLEKGCGTSLIEERGALNYESHETSTCFTRSETSSSGTLTPPVSPPTASSIMTDSTITKHLTSPDYSYCSSLENITMESKHTQEHMADQQRLLYERLKGQIEDLLGSRSEGDPVANVDDECMHYTTSSTEKHCNTHTDVSLLNIPRIKFSPNDFTQLSDITLDSNSNMAEIISKQYLTTSNEPIQNKENTTDVDYSMATHNYMVKHGLLVQKDQQNNILDVDRLRNVPKLM